MYRGLNLYVVARSVKDACPDVRRLRRAKIRFVHQRYLVRYCYHTTLSASSEFEES